ncbi:MAG TPA: J domain-containing protein [Acetobacteraceae bacterium]
MSLDPNGYYDRLGISPDAGAEEIAIAYRRRARIVHPDVPSTGDAAAFVALKAAYDVLSDPLRRAAYDRSGRKPMPVRPAIRPAPAVRVPDGGSRALPILAALLGAAGIVTFILLARNAHSPTPAVSRPITASIPPIASLAVRQHHLVGETTHYVAPGPDAAILWMKDPANDRLYPAGRVKAFAGVHALGLVPEHGLMAVALDRNEIGFIDAARLVPGDAAAARRAFCADQAGAPPANAELLARHSTSGDARLVIHNAGEQPAVVKLRDPGGRTEVSLYVGPRMNVTVVGLPAGPWHADVAIGELWSRACGLFAAGMRAQRLAATIAPGGELTVPLDLSAASVAQDISDQAFQRD